MDSVSFLVTSQIVAKLLEGLSKTDWRAAAKTSAKDVADTDWDEVTADAARKNADGVDEKVRLDAARSALAKMVTEAKALDPELQDPAMRVVDVNTEWLRVEEKNLDATSQDDGQAAEARELRERAQREIASFKLLQGMHDATKSSAKALEEITAARKLADKQQSAQTTFNKRMTWSAVFIALGSLLASLVMPAVQEFVWPDPPPEVVVIKESDLTVPPLLRRLGP